jgi:hypothetical protein
VVGDVDAQRNVEAESRKGKLGGVPHQRNAARVLDMGWSPRLTERPPLALPTSKTRPADGGRTVFNFSTTTERPAAFWTSS